MSALALRDDAPRVPVAAVAPPPVEPLIDKFAVAARLGVHFSTVERLIKADGLPVYRLGKADRRQQLRFRWSEVDAWLRARLEGGTR